MEAVVVDQSISACKQIKMIRTTPRSSENLAPINYNIHGGLLQAPPPSLSFSYNPPASLYNQYRCQQLQQVQRQQQQHPPLLPLPVPNRPPHHHQSLPSLPSRTRGLSRPPTTRKANNARSQSLTPKKPKSKPSKKEEAKQISDCLIIASTNRLGPDPNDLPTDVTKVLMTSLSSSSSSSSSSIGNMSDLSGVGVGVGDMDKFSGSIFTLSPPPSSLPLPRFSLQRRLSRNAEAAGIDAGATDNLRRLLRLR
ncbi:uncharacterized protein LOC110771250 [Prunus avium]|uniref:Uncharacterized protein LOC110771250 n=1 Tax=Prunus avium TaxID=42229 RepID=A0A6P5TVN2_PRUAV|nr:uncharacterized protein LOC110771250 [Prunus avium]